MTESTPSWMEKVEKTAQEIASNIGCYLYDIEFIGLGKNRILRLYIDRDAKSTAGALAPEQLPASLQEDAEEAASEDTVEGSPGSGLDVINPEVAPGESRGVSIDDCSRVSKALNAFLDETDIIPGSAYNLEVSTPGLDRILRKAWHFEKVVGKKIWVKVRGSLEQFGVTDSKLKNAKQVEDVLTAFDGVTLSFNVKGVDVKIPFSAVEKSKVVFVYSKGLKK
jgi:ribosome maturation factor RimP